MCECCSAHTYSLGDVIPGWDLVRARQKGNIMGIGDWGLHTFLIIPFNYNR